MAINNFPDTPGLYLAQRGREVFLVKISGKFPMFTIGRSVDISGLIAGGGVKEASKEQLSHIVSFPNEWKFRILPSIDISVFPKTSFRPDGFVDIDPETRSFIREQYYRLCQQGIPYSDIMRALAYEYNITMDQVRQLVNGFDQDAYAH